MAAPRFAPRQKLAGTRPSLVQIVEATPEGRIFLKDHDSGEWGKIPNQTTTLK